MFRRMVLFLLTASVLLALASPAGAFDGKRKGFMLGFGLGPALSSYTQTLGFEGLPGATSDRQNDLALRTDFRIGFGASELVQVYWMSKVNWFGMKNVLDENVTIANGVGGVGLTYFLKPTDPSPYLLAGLGFSTWSTPFETGSEAWYGFGLALGAGYQFRNHLAIEGGFTWGKPSKTSGGLEVSSNALSFGVTLNYIAF
jgi:hypothetical protein